ncbi:hypothetical protein L7F22_047603 [Adiantum nelumboides]|nr:hypothetical protein [Adiantum nelumboides]
MLRVACLRVLILSTTFLQIATAAGFCLTEIGALMSRDGLEELEMFCLKARQETESELYSGTLEDDNCFLDNSQEDDDIQEQFMFDEDDELCEGSSQNDYSRLHPAGLSKPSAVQSPVLAHKVKSMASPGQSIDIEYDNFFGQIEANQRLPMVRKRPAKASAIGQGATGGLLIGAMARNPLSDPASYNPGSQCQPALRRDPVLVRRLWRLDNNRLTGLLPVHTL